MLKQGRPCWGHPPEDTLLQNDCEIGDIRAAIPWNYNIEEDREIFVC